MLTSGAGLYSRSGPWGSETKQAQSILNHSVAVKKEKRSAVHCAVADALGASFSGAAPPKVMGHLGNSGP